MNMEALGPDAYICYDWGQKEKVRALAKCLTDAGVTCIMDGGQARISWSVRGFMATPQFWYLYAQMPRWLT
jgi:hypothetical protein